LAGYEAVCARFEAACFALTRLTRAYVGTVDVEDKPKQCVDHRTSGIADVLKLISAVVQNTEEKSVNDCMKRIYMNYICISYTQ